MSDQSIHGHFESVSIQSLSLMVVNTRTFALMDNCELFSLRKHGQSCRRSWDPEQNLPLSRLSLKCRAEGWRLESHCSARSGVSQRVVMFLILNYERCEKDSCFRRETPGAATRGCPRAILPGKDARPSGTVGSPEPKSGFCGSETQIIPASGMLPLQATRRRHCRMVGWSAHPNRPLRRFSAWITIP